jgi:hypothetical protein
VSRWAKFVGLLLVAVMLVIVVAPDFDLPPTAVRSAIHRVHVSPLHAITSVSIALLLPWTAASPVPLVFSSLGDLQVSLIDLNCARLC